MDPNQWRNYNQAYGHLGHSTGISPAASNLNRFDLPLLNPEQGALGTGLGLPPSLQSHPSAVSARSMGAISAVPVSYAHPLHNPMSQFLEAVNPLQSFPSQNPYKSLPVGQSTFGLDSASLRSPEQTPSIYGFTGVGESRSLSKPLFGQDGHLSKDNVSSFALSTPTSQLTEKTSKSGWGLSNFVPTPSTPFGNFSGSEGSPPTEQPGPPPAHSGNSSSSRLSSIQRNPLPVEELFSHTNVSKSAHLPHSFLDKHEDLLLNSQALLRSESNFSTPSGHGIEDLTKLTKPTSQNVFSNFSTPVSSKSDSSSKYESSVKYQTQLSSDVNYEPVSPPSSLSDNGPSSQGYNPVNLQDLNSLSQPQNSSLKMERGIMHQDTSQVIMHAHPNKTGSLQNIPQELSSSMHSTHSPLQQSPVSVGGSPHMQMPMSSPQAPLPTSTVVQAPPPIQAIPDSTTKPKRGRGRKKKDQENKAAPKFPPDTMTSHHMRGDMMGMPSQIQNQTNIVGMGNHAYSQQSNPYSPQKSYSPHTSQQFSPKKSPQSYSPQIQQQQIIEKVYNSNQPSPLMDKHYPMPPSISSNLAQNQMQQQLPSSSGGMIVSASDQMPVVADSVIRSNQGSVIQSMTSPSTSSPQEHITVSSMSLANSLSIANQPLVDGMEGTNYSFNHVSSQSFVEQLQSDMPDHLNKSPMDDPLSMPALELAEPHGQYLSPQQNASYVSPPPNSIYTDLDNFNNQFGHPQPGLTSPSMGFNSPCNNHTSTIDEDALSSLIGNPSMRDASPMKDLSPDRMRHRTKAEQKHMPTRTVTCQPEFDDDLQHLTKPPVENKDPPNTMKPRITPRLSAVPLHQKPAEIPPPPPPVQPKPEPNVIKPKNSSNSFMDSFLSFIQGKKPETLSSVNMANVKKPELPKYIPEPRRHRPVEVTDNKNSSDSAASTPRGDTELSSNTGGNSPSMSQNEDTANSLVTFSDEDDDGSNITSTVQNVLSHLDDSVSGKKESLKVKISLGKASIRGNGKKSGKMNTSGGKVKKFLKSGKKSKSNRSKSFSHDTYVVSSGDEEFRPSSSEEEVKEASPPAPVIPLRQLSSRKAKEKGIQKQKKYKDSSDSDISIPDPINKVEEDIDYDSDKDPAWTPFAVDNKRQPSYDQVDFHAVRGRSKVKSSNKGKGRGQPKKLSRRSRDSYDPPHPVKVQRMSEDDMNGNQRDTNEYASPDTETSPAPGFNVGDYVMDKKDLNNFENFPIWRIESGRMIRKYELITEQGKIHHRPLCTFSSWLTSMQKEYIPVRVKVISWMKDKEIVEVLEEDRPKPKLDRSLEHAYEEDPLADLFNVYLQIFLSQALEPGFLSAIGEEVDNFYMGPLKSIDKTIEKKLQAIEERVQWRDTFRKALRAKPHIRELDRPNLKQSCQACESASQPAIKSIHLFGQSYDHFSLEEHPSSSTEGGSVEFMIGKTAANNVGVYHSLYHFKYNLYKRCLAKVDIVKQSDADLDNAEVLDRCLNNRTWVLKIFDDLKTMLDKG